MIQLLDFVIKKVKYKANSIKLRTFLWLSNYFIFFQGREYSDEVLLKLYGKIEM